MGFCLSFVRNVSTVSNASTVSNIVSFLNDVYIEIKSKEKIDTFNYFKNGDILYFSIMNHPTAKEKLVVILG